MRLAGKVGLGTRQLERLFKEEAGQSPQATYLRLRLKHARWISKTDLSLAAIAAETGFVEGSHFSKAFKAAFNTSPSEERRKIIGQRHEQNADDERRIFSLA